MTEKEQNKRDKQLENISAFLEKQKGELEDEILDFLNEEAEELQSKIEGLEETIMLQKEELENSYQMYPNNAREKTILEDFEKLFKEQNYGQLERMLSMYELM